MTLMYNFTEEELKQNNLILKVKQLFQNEKR